MLLGPIERQSFVVARLGQIRATCVLMDIPQMPHGVGQQERIVQLAAKRDGFSVECASGVPFSEIPFDLTERLERAHQVVRRVRFTTERNGLDQIPMGIGQPVLAAGVGGLV